MDERFILEDELKQVIFQAEENGAALINKDNGRLFAHQRIGSVTYWVEYKKSGGVFEVVSAYSHRIQLAEEHDDS